MSTRSDIFLTAVILSGAPARVFCPASFAGRADAQPKDLRFLPVATKGRTFRRAVIDPIICHHEGTLVPEGSAFLASHLWYLYRCSVCC